MANLYTFGDYIFDRKDKFKLFFHGPLAEKGIGYPELEYMDSPPRKIYCH